MDDNDKKPPRKRGPKQFDARARHGGKDGKPGPGERKPFAKKPFAKKPYTARSDEKPTGDERPKRDFRRDDRAQESRGDRPFRKDRAFDKPAFDKPFEKRPYAKREGAAAARPGRAERAESSERGDRVQGNQERREKAPWRDRESGDRPFGKRPQRPFADGVRGGERSSDRPRRDFDPTGKKPAGFKPRPRPVAAEVEEGERIAKRLARAGIASRRDAEDLIAAGRVKVNGKVLASPAFNVSPSDVIHLDDTEIPAIERTRLFLFHKPAGVVTTNRDPEGRKTVFDVLPAELPRLMTIGRLDINTEGLLLLTNDGGLSRVLELPATGWLRRYRVRVHGKVEEKALADLKDGIAVGGVFYGAVEATLERTQGTNAWLTIGLREGKNREVKNILGALGLEVTRLIRVSYGPFQLGELPEGHVMEIKGRTLREQLGERLIEESGANFEADIAKPFSNRPVRRDHDQRERPSQPRISREGDRRPIGEGGLIKNRKRREDERDTALGKLSTRPERSSFGERTGKPVRRDRKEDDPRPEPHSQRKANVWMAPGARPQGRKPDADTHKGREGGPKKPFSGKPRADRPRGGPPRTGPGKGPKGR
ncbi:pseudouridine synthase [Mesorhizobium sp. SP-1A]|uniref:pseudouridine synthase n=1 Tax=Mesorhizobium sp. SP-1A TaxID=3077840 RepID=UPI0028F6FDD4|nr:pseudouridine synthase [Mesorhizobium sp. SP-1A]